MNLSEQPPTIPRIRKRYIVLIVFLILVGLAVNGVAGYFRLGSEATALRKSVTNNGIGHWDKKIAVHVGGLTTCLVRWGLSFVKIPPEAHAALNAVQAGEVGIYKLRQEEEESINSAAIFQAADKSMGAKGWERAVGVVKDHDLVAVYLPRRGLSTEQLKCCVMVMHERDLVVVSARGNIEPLLKIAEQHLDLHGKMEEFAKNNQ